MIAIIASTVYLGLVGQLGLLSGTPVRKPIGSDGVFSNTSSLFTFTV